MPPSNSKPQPKVAAPQKAVESKVSKKVEAAAPAPAAVAPVAQAAGGKKAAAPKAAAKAAEVVAPAAAPVAQAAGGKKAAAPKAAKAAAPVAEKAAAPQKAAGKKAAAPKAEKAAKAPKAPKAKKEVVEADEDAEDAKGVRSFKVQLPGTEEYSGRFTGLTPYQAANKALSKYFRENKQAKTEITFSIRESTRGSKRSTYSYNGKREKLAVPVKYSIKSADGEAREIVKEYKNRLTKVKKADVKEASA